MNKLNTSFRHLGPLYTETDLHFFLQLLLFNRILLFFYFKFGLFIILISKFINSVDCLMGIF